MKVAERIDAKLRAGLAPERLDITDESHLHAGHAGARADGESHFRLLIVSSKFDGVSRVARQRLVNDLLREELSERIHALAMKTLTPAEYEKEAAQSR
ncbi:MAG TPA: BolA family protein [Parvularculaceae bacterium]|nr:BolA family protein [Parvularculaceae bacterium]HNS88353.1 BolA family protein [Parvularculaceae bacterium]